uniref:C2 domain-containing protein n=1 Tax=Macrostomum lignano TaxID=282301 RepID=A0A1I8FCJ4_9PLAT
PLAQNWICKREILAWTLGRLLRPEAPGLAGLLDAIECSPSLLSFLAYDDGDCWPLLVGRGQVCGRSLLRPEIRLACRLLPPSRQRSLSGRFSPSIARLSVLLPALEVEPVQRRSPRIRRCKRSIASLNMYTVWPSAPSTASGASTWLWRVTCEILVREGQADEQVADVQIPVSAQQLEQALRVVGDGVSSRVRPGAASRMEKPLMSSRVKRCRQRVSCGVRPGAAACHSERLTPRVAHLSSTSEPLPLAGDEAPAVDCGRRRRRRAAVATGSACAISRSPSASTRGGAAPLLTSSGPRRTSQTKSGRRISLGSSRNSLASTCAAELSWQLGVKVDWRARTTLWVFVSVVRRGFTQKSQDCMLAVAVSWRQCGQFLRQLEGRQQQVQFSLPGGAAGRAAALLQLPISDIKAMENGRRSLPLCPQFFPFRPQQLDLAPLFSTPLASIKLLRAQLRRPEHRAIIGLTVAAVFAVAGLAAFRLPDAEATPGGGAGPPADQRDPSRPGRGERERSLSRSLSLQQQQQQQKVAGRGSRARRRMATHSSGCSDCRSSRGNSSSWEPLTFSVLYDKVKQTLLVTVIRCDDLPSRDPQAPGAADPYVKLQLLPEKRHKVKTRVLRRHLQSGVRGDLQLLRGQAGARCAPPACTSSSTASPRDEIIGEVLFPLGDMDPQDDPFSITREIPARQFKIRNQNRGELLVSLCYQPAASRLTAVVLKARNLPKMDVTGLA